MLGRRGDPPEPPRAAGGGRPGPAPDQKLSLFGFLPKGVGRGGGAGGFLMDYPFLMWNTQPPGNTASAGAVEHQDRPVRVVVQPLGL